MQNCKIIQKNIILQRINEVLITGTVLNRQCEPLREAIIAVVRINYSEHIPKEKTLGYIMTNQNGKFAITIKKQDNINYRLDVYEPMMS